MGLKRHAAHVLDNAGHHVTAAFQHTHNRRLASGTATALSGTLTANHRLVDFHMAGQRRVAINSRQKLADFMAHAPRGFIRHAQLALQFLRRNAVARRREEVHRVIPLLQRRVGAMENRPRHRMNVLAALTGIGGHLRELAELALFAAARAFIIRAITGLEQMFKASVVVGKHLHEILDRKGLGHDPNSVALKAI